MARPRSDKRNAIINAAVAEFAVRGVWSTPTSVISKSAGIAEGTLFNYFATKEVLINEVYCELKKELAEVIMHGFPRSADARSKFEYFWNEYVNWGARNPNKVIVMNQLRYSDQITDESRAAGSAPFAELSELLTKSMQEKLIREYPVDFIGAMIGGMAELTMAFVANHKPDDIDYCATGFETLWRGIALK
jgi:AcrR family transcriptional regulator